MDPGQRQGDPQALEFPDPDFDTMVCTFSLCAIPDDRRAVEEMARVLQPGGLLLLAVHDLTAARTHLETWHILRKLRCCPWKAGQLAKAIHLLQTREIAGCKGSVEG